MALFANPFAKAPPKRKRGERGASKSGKERLELEEARFLTSIKRDDPELWKEIMKARLGYAKGGTEIDRLIDLQAKLKMLRGEDDGGDTLGRIAKAAMPFLGMAIGGTQAIADRAHITQVASGEEQPALPPAPRSRRRGPRRPSKPAAESSVAVGEYVRANVADKSPLDAATWLIAQKEPLIVGLVRVVAETSPFQLPGALEKLKADPDWAPLVTYLDGRQDWAKETIKQVRALYGERRKAASA